MKRQTPPEWGLKGLTPRRGPAMIDLRSNNQVRVFHHPILIAICRHACAGNSGLRAGSGYHGIGSETASRAVRRIARDPNKMQRPMYVGTESNPQTPRQSEPFTGMLCLCHRTKSIPQGQSFRTEL